MNKELDITRKYHELLSEFHDAQIDICNLRSQNQMLRTTLDTKNKPDPPWVTLHQKINETITNLMYVPKFLWKSRPRVTITCGWFKE